MNTNIKGFTVYIIFPYFVCISYGSPASGATWEYLDDGKFKVTYTEANEFLFRCIVTDNDSLEGMGSVAVTVRTPEGTSIVFVFL